MSAPKFSMCHHSNLNFWLNILAVQLVLMSEIGRAVLTVSFWFTYLSLGVVICCH